MFRFANPEFLFLLLILPVMLFWYLRRSLRSRSTVRYSDIALIKEVGTSSRQRYRHLLFLLRLAALALMIIAFARPQAGSREEEMITEGIDIVLSMDISSSMLAEDFQPKNRLEAAKLVAADFIKGRSNDRIGMVVFAGQSFTQCPLTLDYGILLKFLEEIHIGQIEDGTAIGMGLGTSINRLRDSKAKSKVVILLTDGQNNRGELDPITAARIAKSFNIRVYTIGAGSKGEALYPVDDPIFGRRYVRMPVNIDEELLRRVANMSGGQYFRATDKSSLERIYKEISEMEKTKIEVKQYTRYRELFSRYLIAALILLALEVILGNTVFRKIP
ncbi:MAG TPA: VWA domain-containing protein [bacterium]|nr:VWA domain-containing protein [bacterium]HPG84493.1 VWA domain-containing protein [bacterium]